jgi:hypothetical protein
MILGLLLATAERRTAVHTLFNEPLKTQSFAAGV